MPAATAVPRPARTFVAVFLAVFVICGLVGIEAWPFTGWRLFSRSRTEHARGFEAVAVTSDGTQTPIPFERMSAAYRGSVQVLQEFASLPPAERAAVCRVWEEAAEVVLGPIAQVRIFRTEAHLSRRAGRRGEPGARTLVQECPS